VLHVTSLITHDRLSNRYAEFEVDSIPFVVGKPIHTSCDILKIGKRLTRISCFNIFRNGSVQWTKKLAQRLQKIKTLEDFFWKLSFFVKTTRDALDGVGGGEQWG
jgi:hypothetical protein